MTAASTAVAGSVERTSIISSAKMHLKICQAHIQYFHETGSVPKEIEDLLSDLKSSSRTYSIAVVEPKTKTPAPKFDILSQPLTVTVLNDHVCSNFQRAMANRGDSVVVFAWTNNRTEAIAYVPRNKTSGRIPAELLDWGTREPYLDSKLYMTTSDSIKGIFGRVEWKAGDYIRVWDKKDGSQCMSSGFGFNLATGKIGAFSTSKFDLTAI